MDIVEQIRQGDVRTSARLIRDIDDGVPEARTVLKALYPYTGRAHIIGITGAPGVGKSTLTDKMIQYLRQQHQTVGVVAVDPTSPFSGGAILGDRVRMQRHATDEGVFIRSLATRGHFGGLTVSARAVVAVLDAMGKDYILVETVGVGQDEVEIVSTAHTTLVVTVPGMGDDIQAIKAGILEVGNLFVINKADREGAERTYQDLVTMLEMRAATRDADGWQPGVYLTEAPRNIGIEELMQGILAHQKFLQQDGGKYWQKALYQRTRAELVDLIKAGVIRRLMRSLTANDRLEELISDILAKKTDPYTVSEDIVARTLKKCEF
ncbi:MAG: GTPase [Desulfobacca sp. 4484_104]|nr:MAG: GTPase [Desulfobacca sp. 4484_104]RLA87607.1 MAG: methylmalonyl Co-A mutase-associated GTPase MeaB [Deltaproteobacteria bacterium]